MTYPNGSLLVDISYATSGKPELYEDRSGAYIPYENYCYLRNDNLTVLKLQRPTTYFYIYRPYPEGLEIWKLNMTMSEGTVIWRALGRHEYAMNIPISYTYPLYRMSGKMGWTEWR